MAVGVLSEVRGLTAEMYDAVTAKANVESDPPVGLIVHTAGPMDGGFRIFDVWETREDHDRFISERLDPAIGEVSQQFGGGPSGPPNRSIYQLHSFLAS
jgi:hypothetical protein